MRVITIGRSAENDVVINDPKVSRHHAQIVQQDNGSVYIVDLDSSNGTYVNESRIYNQRLLHTNDRVRVYRYTINWQQYVKPKKETTNNVWAIVLAIIVIAGVIGAIIYFINNKSSSSSSNRTYQYSQSVGSRSNMAGAASSSTNSVSSKNGNSYSNTYNNNNYSDYGKVYGPHGQEARRSLPTQEQLKEDLIGRKLIEPQPGYHGKDWYWMIEDGEIQSISIQNQYSEGNSYVYSIVFCVHAVDGTGVTHQFTCDFVYTKQGDHWLPSILKSKKMDIVRTYLYDDCITHEKKGIRGEYEVEFTNYCDIDVVVGGVYQLEYSNKGWQKFACVVPANGKKSIGGLFIGSVDKYKIHFVERGD